MSIRVSLFALFAAGLLVGSGRAHAADLFTNEVAPLLQRHCVRCHGGDHKRGGLSLTTGPDLMRGGDDGEVLTPNHPELSRLIQMVSGERPEMPKKGDPLTKAQVEVLTRWIASGAEWPADVTLKQASSADASWWSLQPIEPVTPPLINDEWVRNPIDVFVLKKLHERGLTPSPEADRRTLIRRLHFDLTGLPPTPEQIDAFVSDTAGDAYERAVDRLLASPHHGERWARHWLDVARYGESKGFERNEPRHNAWHYRDWVIDALNADMPYDRFVRMQLAGDLIEPGYEGQAAVGFLVAGVHNTTVGSSPRMQRLAREDELEEILGTTSQALLGITAQCARCHDHKFDPVSQADYYRLTSAISGVGFGEREVIRADLSDRLVQVDKRLDELRGQIDSIESEARKRVLAQRKANPESAVEPPKPIARWEFDGDGTDAIGELDAELVGSARIENGALVVDGNGYAATPVIGFDLREKTLEAWVRLDSLDQRGGGVISVQTPNGQFFDAIVFGEKEPRRWMAGSNFFARTQSFNASAEDAAADRAVHIAIVYADDGTITAYRKGEPYGTPYKTGVQSFESGKAQVIFGMRHSPAGDNRMLRGRIERAQLHDRALTPDAVAASAGVKTDYVSAEEIATAITDADRVRYRKLVEQRDVLAHERSRLDSGGKVKMHTITAIANPTPTKILFRGDIENEGPVVAPSGIASLTAVDADWRLEPNAPDADRRRKLADWVTHPDNPLFHRVIVNRVWHYHLGAGIVTTPNDLGYNGGRPSHPELLDWLALRFKADGYRLKKLHRLIVTSATYRQASSPRADALAMDADNRLLWRRAPVRMEGEVLRDTLLAVSGTLNPAIGGKPFYDVDIRMNNGTTYYFPFDKDDPDLHRRTIYRFTPRGGRQALLDVFDCPDPSTTAPDRAVTTTPLQALSLMNNAFVLRMADAFAERVQRESPNTDDQVARTYQLLLGRAPTDAERAAAGEFVATHGLAALGRAMFNTNEFIMIE